MDLDGAHTVTRRKDGAIVINRHRSPHAAAADLYDPSDRTLVIERLPHRTNVMLRRYHRRRGYATGYALDTAHAAMTVDLVIAAMVFWVLSGLWMWWEMKVTRPPSARSTFPRRARALFALFLATI